MPEEELRKQEEQRRKEAERQAELATQQRLAAIAASQAQMAKPAIEPLPQGPEITTKATVQNESGAPAVISSSQAPAGVEVEDEDLAELRAANQAVEQNFMDRMNAEYQRQQEEKARMQIQEKGDRWSAIGTGATELAAGIVNMLGVGQLHASNQQYRSYSQDWMKQAEANIQANRRRRDDMRAVMDRLQTQLDQVRYGNSLKEWEYKQQQKQAAIAKADRDAKFEWEKGIKEREIDLAERKLTNAEGQQAIENDRAEKLNDARIKNINADTAQGWAKYDEAKKKDQMSWYSQGYVPDPDSPFGWRHDPVAAAKWVNLNGGGKGSSISIPLLEYKQNGQNLPAETLTVPDEATLKNALFSNIDAVTDLSESQKQDILDIMRDESKDAQKKADELKRYLVSSGQLRSLIRTKTQGDAQASTTPYLDSKKAGHNSYLDSKKAGQTTQEAAPATQQGQQAPTTEAPSQEAPTQQPKEEADSPYKIDAGRYSQAASGMAMKAINRAVEEYNRTHSSTWKDNWGKEHSGQAISPYAISEAEIRKGLRNGKTLQEIVADSKYLPQDLADYLTEDDLMALTKIAEDRDTLSARDFARLHLSPAGTR